MATTLAVAIAQALCAMWSIGHSSHFCDETDWDAAEESEVAEVVQIAIDEFTTGERP